MTKPMAILASRGSTGLEILEARKDETDLIDRTALRLYDANRNLLAFVVMRTYQLKGMAISGFRIADDNVPIALIREAEMAVR